MIFKSKLRRIGNSLGVIIPIDVITNYKKDDIIELEVITNESKKVITDSNVITQKKIFNTVFCNKHSVMKGSCGCP